MMTEETHYDKFYKKGGFGYDKKLEHHKKWIYSNFIKDGDIENTVLDVGCGDGFWSVILSPHFKSVTGVEPSRGGIEMANKRKIKLELNNTTFLVGNGLDVEDKFDVLFLRAPSFFNCPPSSDLFFKSLEKMTSLYNKRLVWITPIKKPYNTWNPAKSSYFQDPTNIDKVFSKYGNTTIEVIDNYLIATITK